MQELNKNIKRFNNDILQEYLEVYKRILSIQSKNNIMDIYQEHIKNLIVKWIKEY
ncbi:MAG: hypothetical protein ACK5HR_04670 [Mycoplasmatales bacterium]